jgi:hypothetical protein
MVIQASSQNPVTGKRVRDDRVCNIHHFLDGKLARMEDFRGEPACAKSACLLLRLWSAAHLRWTWRRIA